jgi:RHS repeat-associated protein
VFDIDADWPAPGWSLGFGKIIAVSTQTSLTASILVEPDGTRHPFKLDEVRYFNDSQLLRVRAHSTDGSLIDYETWERTGQASERTLQSAVARYPNGMEVEFSVPGRDPGVIYPTRITDSNGNYISVSYRNSTGPEIDKVTDTLGRVVSFHYDSANQLTAVSGPGLGGGERVFIRLHYRPIITANMHAAALNAGAFASIRGTPGAAIDALFYPGTGAGYWFGDSDSYSGLEVITKISERRGMTMSAQSLADQGTITAGSMTWERGYKYPNGVDPVLVTQASTYTSTEVWEGMDAPAAVTSYALDLEATPRRLVTTYPSGRTHVRLAYNSPGNFNDGLVYQEEVFDGTPKLLRRTIIDWELGDYNSPRARRVEQTDELGQTTWVGFTYGVFNRVEEMIEYDYGGAAILRRTRTEYNTDSGYIGRHILTLPTAVEIYAGYESQPQTRTEFEYDGQVLRDAPDAVSHSMAFNPYAPKTWIDRHCEWDCEPGRNPRCIQTCSGGYWVTDYKDETRRRGNLTRTRRYVDAKLRTGPVIEDRYYDITGNLISVSGSCCVTETFEYILGTQYAYPTGHITGSTDPASTARIPTRATYDFSTGLQLTLTYPSGAIRQVDYDPASLRPHEVWWPSLQGMSRTTYVYNDTMLRSEELVRDANLSTVLAHRVRLINGLGQVRRTEVLGEGYWNIVETRYDDSGRLWQRTRPFREGQAKNWSEWTYDALDRIIKHNGSDGSGVESFFNEGPRPSGASPSLGQTLRIRDAWGHERWMRTNALGKLAEVVEPGPSGGGSVLASGHVATYYNYDVIGRLVEVVQLPRPQIRRFRYDGLGRLTHQYLPEKLATLNDVGGYRTIGSIWSDLFSYDDHSNLIAHIDARGVKSLFEYHGDPLDRLQVVRYDTSGFGDTDYPIVPAPEVRYEYMSVGDVTRQFRTTVAGVGSEEFEYDAQGRLASTTLTFTSHPNMPLKVGYTFDDATNRPNGIVYPAEYGTPSAPRRLARTYYGVAGRARSLLVGTLQPGAHTSGGPATILLDSSLHASEIVYDASGQMQSVKIGRPGNEQRSESYEYDPATGWLMRQLVQRENKLLMDLSYGYVRPGRAGRTGQLARVVDNIPQLLIGPLSPVGVNLPSFRYQALNYHYDSVGRLSGIAANYYPPLGPPDAEPKAAQIGTPSWSISYNYDSYGNRIDSGASVLPRSPVLSDGLSPLTYDTKTNRITNSGFRYDAAGNQTRNLRSDGTWQRLQYDAAGRLKRVIDDPDVRLPLITAEESYAYGSDRRRIMRERKIYTPGLGSVAAQVIERTYYAWHANAVLAEFSEAGALPQVPQWSRSYVYLGRRLISTLSPSSHGVIEHYFHPDRLGIRLVTRDNDPDTFQKQTLPFGTALASSPTEIAHRVFANYDRSLWTGLDYALNRVYDSRQGRMTQPDPLEIGSYEPNDPQSLNLYLYSRNDPINRHDPFGLQVCDVDAIEQTLPDGGTLCTYLYPKTVYETTVRARPDFDASQILLRWGWQQDPLIGPWLSLAHKEEFEQQEESRRRSERELGCKQARADFSSALQDYAVTAAELSILYKERAVLGIQMQAEVFAAAENIMELNEDFSAGQAFTATAERGLNKAALEASLEIKNDQIALSKGQRERAIQRIRKAEEAKNAACLPSP